MIKKEKDGYHVYSEMGKHMGGPYSMDKAKKRLQQMEMFKHMKSAETHTEFQIKSEDGGFVVKSDNGKKMGGPYKTKEEALKRSKQIEMFEHMKKAEYVFDKLAKVDYLKAYQNNQIYPEFEGGKFVNWSDPVWKKKFDLLENESGKSYIKPSGGMPKLIYEGFGLKKFTGKFNIPKSFVYTKANEIFNQLKKKHSKYMM